VRFWASLFHPKRFHKFKFKTKLRVSKPYTVDSSQDLDYQREPETNKQSIFFFILYNVTVAINRTISYLLYTIRIQIINKKNLDPDDTHEINRIQFFFCEIFWSRFADWCLEELLGELVDPNELAVALSHRFLLYR